MSYPLCRIARAVERSSARGARQERLSTSRGLCRDIKGRARGWLVAAGVLAALAAPAVAATFYLSYADARPILGVLRQDLIPEPLRGMTPAEVESAWPAWVGQRDREIRARLERGDEDSVVNLLLFGVSFTRRPRFTFAGRSADATPVAVRVDEMLAGGIVRGRLDDLVAGMASPGENERLRFATQVVRRRGIEPTTPAGRAAARRYLEESLRRLLVEYYGYSGTAGPSTLFRDRGLSSDTSILAAFAIDRALEDVARQRAFGPGGVERVAIIGPGLDFTDKAEGYDFYPQQTIQPLAVVDSLVRRGLADRDRVRVTTFDLSPRVNAHIATARDRARLGEDYVIHLPRDRSGPWSPAVVVYWGRFGDQVGVPIAPHRPPSQVTMVAVRAVAVRASVVASLAPHDLDVVLQRFSPATDAERFDLIVATNILLYYDVFEQALALENIAAMLRRGGLFLTNEPILLLPPTPLDARGTTEVIYTKSTTSRPRAGRDVVTWYQRQ